MQTFVAPARHGPQAPQDDALGHDAIAFGQARDAGADRLDDAGPLVPERKRIAHEGGIDETVAQLDVRAAQTAEGRLHDDLSGTGLELSAIRQHDTARPVDDERAPHAGTA